MMKKPNAEYWKVFTFGGFLFCIVVLSCVKNSTDSGSLSGIWKCDEIGKDETRLFDVDLAVSRNDTTVYKIYNFHNSGTEEMIYFKLTGSIISIERQTIGTKSIFVEGTGTLDPGRRLMNLTYTVNEGFGIIDYSARLSRP